MVDGPETPRPQEVRDQPPAPNQKLLDYLRPRIADKANDVNLRTQSIGQRTPLRKLTDLLSTSSDTGILKDTQRELDRLKKAEAEVLQGNTDTIGSMLVRELAENVWRSQEHLADSHKPLEGGNEALAKQANELRELLSLTNTAIPTQRELELMAVSLHHGPGPDIKGLTLEEKLKGVRYPKLDS